MFSQLLSPDTFEFFARYLLAGYVVIIVRSRFVVGPRGKTSDFLIEAVILSLMVQLVVFLVTPLLGWVSPRLSIHDLNEPYASEFTLFLEVLLLPAVIGIVFGRNLSAGWNNAVLRRLSMPVIHPVQRAHDFAFGNERKPCFVIITYDDGTVARGFFGEASLAASDKDRSDIYLERLYDEGADG